jgi:spoIIIJ-associated protein
MSPYEFEGKTIEKAVEKACKTLNLSKDRLKYDVISYGSSGIFGLVGVKKARIRVTSPEVVKKAVSSPNTRNKKEDAPGNHRSLESENKSSPQSISETADRQEIPETADPQETPETDDRQELSETDAPQASSETSGAGESQGISEEALHLGKEVLQRIVDFITTDASISVKETPERIFFNVKGGNTAVLIGKRGQTLEAIQYLVEKVINKHNVQRVRIQVDVEGYLDNRKAKLEGLAARLSEKAKRIGKPVTIGQLNAHDRRIVHIALKDDSGVRTQSMGDGFYRKLVIYPQRRFPRKHRESSVPMNNSQ